MIGAKVNPDHRADLEINEQKQQVLDRGAAFLDHGVERRRGGPDGRRPDCEERENVEAVGEQSAEGIDERRIRWSRSFAWFFRSAMTLPFVAAPIVS